MSNFKANMSWKIKRGRAKGAPNLIIIFTRPRCIGSSWKCPSDHCWSNIDFASCPEGTTSTRWRNLWRTPRSRRTSHCWRTTCWARSATGQHWCRSASSWAREVQECARCDSAPARYNRTSEKRKQEDVFDQGTIFKTFKCLMAVYFGQINIVRLRNKS